jgi:hypothetical protein
LIEPAWAGKGDDHNSVYIRDWLSGSGFCTLGPIWFRETKQAILKK